MKSEIANITGELNTAKTTMLEMRDTIIQLQDANSKLVSEIEALRVALKKAEVSLEIPYIHLQKPHIEENDSGTWLVLTFMNTGQVQTRIKSSELRIYIGGTEYSKELTSTPYLLTPTRTVNLQASLPHKISHDLDTGRTTLNFSIELHYEGILGDAHVSCSRLLYDSAKQKFTGQPMVFERCNVQTKS